MSKPTSDYATVKANPVLFIWGRFIAWHEIGRYSILEFNPYSSRESSRTFEDSISFHVYVDGKDRNCSQSSLEAALVAAIAFGNLEANHARHMTAATFKVLELKP